jgi:hypothetical protein
MRMAFSASANPPMYATSRYASNTYSRAWLGVAPYGDRLVRQLERMGHKVTLESTAA